MAMHRTPTFSGDRDIPICDYCLSVNFGPTKFRLYPIVQNQADLSYTTTVEQIRLSGSSGCNWCQLILCQPDAFIDLVANDAVEIILRRSKLTLDYTPKGSNRYELLVNGWRLHVTAFTEPFDPIAEIVTAREKQHEVNSSDAYQQAKTWIEACKFHRDCGSQEKQKLPTRVIEVSPAATPNTPRLLCSEDIHDHYAALSYCWGMEQDCVTQTHNFLKHLQELPMDKVAQTIKDAIECTRKLGVKYLWVDAFCIIQDSADDKIKELAAMRNIFQAAYVTIVAARAQTVADGFLQSTEPPSPRFTIPVWTVGGSQGMVSLRPEGWYLYDNEPVSARAWTLEENLLSPRLLRYTSETLQWQCQTETKNLGDSILLPAGSTTFRLPLRFFNEEEGQESALRLDNEQTWMNIISSYSERTATLQEDKLRALGGLAEEYHRTFRRTYLAGLWDGPLLPRLLLWSVSEYGSPKQDSYLAPSWSWASLHTKVSYRHGLWSDVGDWFACQVLELSITLKTARLPFGQVVDGFLVVRASLKQGWYEPPQTLFLGGEKGRVEQDQMLSNVLSKQGWHASPQTAFPDGEEGEFKGGLIAPRVSVSTDERMERGFVTCLAILKREIELETDTCVAIDGLLIVPAAKTGTYRRIGVFFGADEKDFREPDQETIKLV